MCWMYTTNWKAIGTFIVEAFAFLCVLASIFFALLLADMLINGVPV